jgi:hypothetical protein
VEVSGVPSVTHSLERRKTLAFNRPEHGLPAVRLGGDLGQRPNRGCERADPWLSTFANEVPDERLHRGRSTVNCRDANVSLAG